MNDIISQFRRIYSDNGSGDHDFSAQEADLRKAHEKLAKATDDLVMASRNLNIAAIQAQSSKQVH